MSKLHTILNHAEHDFELPIDPKAGEVEQRPGESKADFRARMERAVLVFPKFVHPRGEPGDKGYVKGGPTETVITDEQLQFMKNSRIASQWFQRDVKKGGGLEIKATEATTDGASERKGKAA